MVTIMGGLLGEKVAVEAGIIGHPTGECLVGDQSYHRAADIGHRS